jgi:hypothetical protein
MSEFFHSENPPEPLSSRRAEQALDLSPLQRSEIIDNLTSTVDELRVFANPTSIVRTIKDVELNLGEDSRLPSNLSHLNLTSSMLEDGSYKTKLTLPGQTLRLEGYNDQQSGIWRATSGSNELTAVEHTDLVAHLRTILPHNEALDELADTASISDHQINNYLWNALAPEAKDWQDSRQYSASDYAFSFATDPALEDYYNEIGAMLGYIEGPNSKKYTSRISTERPINLSWSADVSAEKPVTVNQEYYFHVEYPKKLNKRCAALAQLALESATISSSRLADLAHTTMLYVKDPTEAYRRTSTLVRDAHLNKDLAN